MVRLLTEYSCEVEISRDGIQPEGYLHMIASVETVSKCWLKKGVRMGERKLALHISLKNKKIKKRASFSG